MPPIFILLINTIVELYVFEFNNIFIKCIVYQDTVLTDKSLQTEGAGAVRRRVSRVKENKGKYFKFNNCKFCTQVLKFVFSNNVCF